MQLLEKLKWLNTYLLAEAPQYKEDANTYAETLEKQTELFRSLINLRHAAPISSEFIEIQDEVLKELTQIKGITDIKELSPVENHIYLWQGDITTLKVDAIVNAANSAMTGCYIPCHKCIDNVIHTYSGVQLRITCNDIMQKQGHLEETGKAKITQAYNLPSKHIIHTVGPIIFDKLEEIHKEQLSNCYVNCLDIAKENNLNSIAFCCISTGEFKFPNEEAADIAISTVHNWLYKNQNYKMEVIFNVFTDKDFKIYSRHF